MKIYTGERTFDGIEVRVDGQSLPLRRDVKQCTQNTFEWGYEGQESEQLAVALLADAADEAVARELSEPFMRYIVANFANEWEMTEEQIREAVAQLSRLAG